MNKINDDQEVINGFKQNTLNTIMNNSILKSDTQNKQRSEVININSSEKFMKLFLIIKFIRISA